MAAPAVELVLSKRAARATLPLESLDQYRPLARVGQGGMAEVLLVSSPTGQELFVLKRQHEEDADDPLLAQMFLDEAAVALLLVHPHVVRTHKLGAFEGRQALLMEYLDGQPIHRVFRRAGERGMPLPLELVAHWFVGVLEGLHHAHEQVGHDGAPLELVHRDVSPHNLIVTYGGAIKILDFGIAKTAIQETRTRTGLLKGKVAYMAPEQARGEPLDRRADVWSAGVVLWEALTGSRLFKGDNEAASLNLTLNGAIPRPSELRADVPVELDRILGRALGRNRDERYPTARAMAQALTSWLMQRRASVGTSSRDLMSELFAQDRSKHHDKIAGILSDGPPRSNSSRTLTSIGGFVDRTPPERSSRSQASTQVDVGRLVAAEAPVGVHPRALKAVVAMIGLLLGAVLALIYVVLTERVPAPVASPAPPSPERVLAPAPEVGAASPVVPERSSPPVPAFVAPEPRAGSRRHAAPRGSDPPRPGSTREEARASASTVAPGAGAEEGFGFLTLDSTPWAIVSSAQGPLGQTPIVRARLKAGSHALELVNPELGLRTSYVVTIQPGATVVRRVGLE